MKDFKKNIYCTVSIPSIVPCQCVGGEVAIGTQIWTCQDLGVTEYRDGTPIPQVTDPTNWLNLTTGAWCYYDNNSANGAIYGKLYNWYAIAGIYNAASLSNPSLRKQLAPNGYHISTKSEWETLFTYLDGTTTGAVKDIMKETGTIHWVSPNSYATNSSCFTALPQGVRSDNGFFYGIGSFAHWWTSTENNTTEGWFYAMDYQGTPNDVYTYATTKWRGFAVRLVKD